MVSFSIANTVKTAARLVGCAALLGFTTAASCEGDGYVETLDVVDPGKCFLQNPVTNPHPPRRHRGQRAAAGECE